MAYNGHKNWNHWNVSLWLFNDEGLYNLMSECVRRAPTLDVAARNLLHLIAGNAALWHTDGVTLLGADMGPAATPDGAPYTFTSVRAALVGWEK